MNYLKEILAFENWVEYNSQINKSDIRLWYTLMYTANKFNWNEFTISISVLIFKSKLSKSDIYRSRNKLKQLGLIDFKERGGNQCAVYQMKSAVSQFGAQNETADETEVATACETANATADAPNLGNINKTKQNSLLTTFVMNSDAQYFQCEHFTKSGVRCKRKSTYEINSKHFCNQHSKDIPEGIVECKIKSPVQEKKPHGEFENVF